MNQILNGRYEIVRSIKSGGMGAVYEASDQNLAGSRCAVKEILESALSSSDADYILASFTKEMKALAQLNHPGIPRVRDFFELNNNRYIVMDLVQGEALDEELATHLQSSGGAGLFPRKLAQDMVGVVEIVQYLHSQVPPLVHRDIKPANLIRDAQSGRILLVDFGLARTVETIHTQTQVGTLGYCAPEQMMGRAEMRSDLYSLGATMAHLLSGKAPNAFNFGAIQVELPGSEGLAKIIERATQPKLEDRYASAADLANDLKAWLSGTSPVPAASPPQPLFVRPKTNQNTTIPATSGTAIAYKTESAVIPNNNREHLATVAVGAMACATLAFGIYRMTSVATPVGVVATPPSATPTPIVAAVTTSPTPLEKASPKTAVQPTPKPTKSPQKPVEHPAFNRPHPIRDAVTDRLASNPNPPIQNRPHFGPRNQTVEQTHMPSVEPQHQAQMQQAAPRRNSGSEDLGSFVRTGDYGYESPSSGTKIKIGRYSMGLEEAKAQMESTGHDFNPSLSPQNEACLYRRRPPHGVHIFATNDPGLVYGLTIEYSRPPTSELLEDVQKVLSDFRSNRL